MSLSLDTLVQSKYPGLILLGGALAWEAMSSSWGPEALFISGAAWSIAALWFENWQLKEQIKPKLDVRFDPSAGAPYIREKPLFHADGSAAGILRIFSVGVVNGGETASDVFVRLMRITPAELQAYWTSALHVANKKRAFAKRTIHTSEHPTAFFEVVSQVIPEPNKPTTSLRVRFAGKDLFERRLPLSEKFFVDLQVDGAGAPIRPVRYVIQRNTVGQYEMRIAVTQ